MSCRLIREVDAEIRAAGRGASRMYQIRENHPELDCGDSISHLHHFESIPIDFNVINEN